MATQEIAVPTATSNGTGPLNTLATKLVSEPGGGAGMFYAAVPLGIALQLGCLGIVLGLLSAANAELFSQAATGIVVPVALSVGSLGIFAGGLINFRAGNMIAGVIGAMYGMFWLSFGLLLALFAGGIGAAAGAASTGDAIGTYLFIWAIVSAFLAVGTYYLPKVVFTQQALLTVVFVVLGIANASAPGGSGMTNLGGYLGLVDAFLALYISAALVINGTAGKDILPFR
jgi:succinate-acetate transporter protein